MDQLNIDFPAPAPRFDDPQLDIVECGTNMAFRFAFRVPVFSKTGKVAGLHLEHAALSNVISKDDLLALCGTTQKFMDGPLGKDMIASARKALAKRFDLTAEQADLMEYTGYSYCEHRPCTKVPAHDARWI